jgi:hypothetical protein
MRKSRTTPTTNDILKNTLKLPAPPSKKKFLEDERDTVMHELYEVALTRAKI